MPVAAGDARKNLQAAFSRGLLHMDVPELAYKQ